VKQICSCPRQLGIGFGAPWPVLNPTLVFWGAFHHAKISGNFSWNINRALWSRRKFSGKSGPPPEVVLFDWSIRSDQNLPFRFQKFSFPVPLHWEVIKLSVKTKWNSLVRLEILFLSNNVIPFSPGWFHCFLTGRSGIIESTPGLKIHSTKRFIKLWMWNHVYTVLIFTLERKWKSSRTWIATTWQGKSSTRCRET